MFDNTLHYIHYNAVAAGFVTNPEDWKYSSARYFCGVKGLVDLSYSQYSLAQVRQAKAKQHTCAKAWWNQIIYTSLLFCRWSVTRRPPLQFKWISLRIMWNTHADRKIVTLIKRFYECKRVSSS